MGIAVSRLMIEKKNQNMFIITDKVLHFINLKAR